MGGTFGKVRFKGSVTRGGVTGRFLRKALAHNFRLHTSRNWTRHFRLTSLLPCVLNSELAPRSKNSCCLGFGRRIRSPGSGELQGESAKQTRDPSSEPFIPTQTASSLLRSSSALLPHPPCFFLPSIHIHVQCQSSSFG